MVMQRGVTNGVLVAPGAAFMADPLKPCNAIRASFAKASYADMDLVSRATSASNLPMQQSSPVVTHSLINFAQTCIIIETEASKKRKKNKIPFLNHFLSTRAINVYTRQLLTI